MSKVITEKDIRKLVMEAIEANSVNELFGRGHTAMSSDTSRRDTGAPSTIAKPTNVPSSSEEMLEELKFLFNSIVAKKGLMGKTVYTMDPQTYQQLASLVQSIPDSAQAAVVDDEEFTGDVEGLSDIDFEPTAKMAPEELPTPKTASPTAKMPASNLPTPKMQSDELPTAKMEDPRFRAQPAPLRKVAETRRIRK